MIYRFGDCEVDTALLQVRRGSAPCPLDPLEFDLLRYLIEQRDRVSTRDELFDALWPGKVVTDSALSTRVKALRSTLGDSGASQTIIKTVRGRGYRFVARLAAPDHVPTCGPSDLREPRRSSPRIAGRDRELAWLREAVEQAPEDRTILLVSGEAGVGKTALTRAFLGDRSARPDALVLEGQCFPQHGPSEAFSPLLDALDRGCRSEPSIAEVLRRCAPAWLPQLPRLAPRAEPSNAAAATAPARGRMLRELSAAIDELGRERSVVLVIEDLHWTDPATLDWLEFHARRPGAAQLAMLLTFRPEDPIQSTGHALALRGHARHLPLDAIREDDAGDYLSLRLGQPASPELARLAYRRSGGFPLFIDSLLEDWLDRGLIASSKGTWSAAADRSSLLAGVPKQLARMIEHELAGMSRTERQLLEVAALAGTRCAVASVAHAAGTSAEQVESVFGRFARQGRLLRHREEVRLPDGTVTASFAFRHELYRDGLAELVAPSRRARLRRALTERLVTGFGRGVGAVAAATSRERVNANGRRARRAVGRRHPETPRSPYSAVAVDH